MANFKYSSHEQRAIYAQMQRKKHERDLQLLQLTALVGDSTTMGNLSGSLLPRFCAEWLLAGPITCVGGIAFTKVSGGVGTADVLAIGTRITVGRKYKVSFELDNWSGGWARTRTGGVYTAQQSTNGIHEEIVTATATAMQIELQAASVGTIKNIQLIQLPTGA